MSRETAEILRRAKARIALPSQWVQGCLAVDAAGEPIQPGDPSACAWCALGSIVADGFDESLGARKAFGDAVGQRYFSRFNDSETTTHADILAAFDRAIAAESATTAAGAE